jgi:O-antigen/teichoic acid export membrane protein
MILTGTSAGMFLGFLMTLATIFREREQFARFTLLTNMHTLVVFGITLVLLISMKGFSLGVIVSVYTGAAVLTGVVALVTILKREKPGMPTREEFRSFMSWGKWMFLISLSFFLFDRMDLFFITRYLSTSDVGIYAAGVQVVLILSATTGALNNVLVPKAVLSLKSRDSLRAYIRESAVPVLMIVAVILILMAASPMLIKGLYGERYAAAVPIAQVLCAGWLIMCVYLPFSYIFYAFERPSVRFYLEFGKLVMGVSLLYFMVPRYGIMGAALAVAVALSVNAVVSGVVLRAILRRSGFVLNGLDAAFLKEPM